MNAPSSQIETSSNATTTAIQSHSGVGVSSEDPQDHAGTPHIPEDESGKVEACLYVFFQCRLILIRIGWNSAQDTKTRPKKRAKKSTDKVTSSSKRTGHTGGRKVIGRLSALLDISLDILYEVRSNHWLYTHIFTSY